MANDKRITPSHAAAAAVTYLDRNALCARWGIGRATTYRMQAEGHLPPPVRFGPGTARWPLAEIERIEAQAAADRGSPVKP